MRGVAPGKADLYLTLVAREVREHMAHQGWHVSVAPRPRKPLRGIHDDPTHYLPLATPDGIVALAVSTLEKAEVAPIAADIVEKWSAMWPRDATLKSTVFASGSPGRPTKPKKGTLKLDKLAASAAWKKLRVSFATANCVGADREVEPVPGERSVGSDGFGFGTSLVPSVVEGA